jgi:hypothetical protein
VFARGSLVIALVGTAGDTNPSHRPQPTTAPVWSRCSTVSRSSSGCANPMPSCGASWDCCPVMRPGPGPPSR